MGLAIGCSISNPWQIEFFLWISFEIRGSNQVLLLLSNWFYGFVFFPILFSLDGNQHQVKISTTCTFLPHSVFKSILSMYEVIYPTQEKKRKKRRKLCIGFKLDLMGNIAVIYWIFFLHNRLWDRGLCGYIILRKLDLFLKEHHNNMEDLDDCNRSFLGLVSFFYTPQSLGCATWLIHP